MIPNFLSPEEAARLIDASCGLLERTPLMVLHSTGMRRSEVAQLKIADIDSQRMVIHVFGAGSSHASTGSALCHGR